jgi:hypothetical protein
MHKDGSRGNRKKRRRSDTVVFDVSNYCQRTAEEVTEKA